jgi:hypothetical protein
MDKVSRFSGFWRFVPSQFNVKIRIMTNNEFLDDLSEMWNFLF